MSVRLSHAELLRFEPNFDNLTPQEQGKTIDRLEEDPKVRDALYQDIDDAYERVRADPNASFKEVLKVSLKKILGEWRLGT